MLIVIAVAVLVVVAVGVERLFRMVVTIVIRMVLVSIGGFLALVRVGSQGRGRPMPRLRKLIADKNHARNGRQNDHRQPQERLASEQPTKKTGQLSGKVENAYSYPKGQKCENVNDSGRTCAASNRNEDQRSPNQISMT